jgi:pyrroline-5-carboxylate reductase
MPDNDSKSRPRLGFIGLGAMGGRMARRLLTAGYDLTVHDRARERARPLEQGGARFAAAQVCAVEHARHSTQEDEDFSAVIRTMRQLAGLTEWIKATEVTV